MNEFWKSRRVLVTGAGGFIGSHLAESLSRAGANVRALVHYNALGSYGWLDRSELQSEMEVVLGDIADETRVAAVCEGMDTVFHLAALISIPYSYIAPESYVRTNIVGTLNVLKAVLASGARRMVHTSTSEVYGTALYVPIDEKHPLQGQSPYSASKIGADKIAEAFHLSFQAPVVTVRPFNTFGPRQSTRAIIPSIITQCLHGEKLKLGSLSPLRDLNFVENTVDGFLAAALSERAVGRTLNISSGREISIGELVGCISQMTNTALQPELDTARLRPEASEVQRLLGDSRLAAELISWTPRVSLEDGLARTIEWFRTSGISNTGRLYL